MAIVEKHGRYHRQTTVQSEDEDSSPRKTLGLQLEDAGLPMAHQDMAMLVRSVKVHTAQLVLVALIVTRTQAVACFASSLNMIGVPFRRCCSCS